MMRERRVWRGCVGTVLCAMAVVTLYSRCGSTWYAQAYGASGPAYVRVAPPPGY